MPTQLWNQGNWTSPDLPRAAGPARRRERWRDYHGVAIVGSDVESRTFRQQLGAGARRLHPTRSAHVAKSFAITFTHGYDGLRSSA